MPGFFWLTNAIDKARLRRYDERMYEKWADRPELDAEQILRALAPTLRSFRVEAHGTVSSTNRLAQEAAEAGSEEGLLIAAAQQEMGRGRKGRSFHSPVGTGLYMSLLLRPKLSFSDASLITPAAAVAAARAIELVSGRSPSIKWVNDVLLDGKKVCGILTEASCDPSTGYLRHAVLGIGVNVGMPENGFPAEIAGIAGAVFPEPPMQPFARERLAAAIVNEFYSLYARLAERDWLPEYVRRSSVIGRRVTVLSAGAQREAQAVGIDGSAHLIVRWDDGTEQALSSGEVSVREARGREAGEGQTS